MSDHAITTQTSPNPVIKEGERVSRRLSRGHYENFSVASLFVPREYRQDLYNIYNFCRRADDFADESGFVEEPDKALDKWEELLIQTQNGLTDSPEFSALGETIRKRKLPLEPFQDLLKAFRIDLEKKRYVTWSELLDYAKYSANPVGRLVLMVFGHNEDYFFAHSDKICTALQLTNHWQDVFSDYQRGRIYIPADDLNRFYVLESDIRNKVASSGFRDLMQELVRRTELLYLEGEPLLGLVGGKLKPQLRLYWGGGMSALEAVRNVNYDVLNKTARVGNLAKTKLLFTAMLGKLLPAK